MRKKVKNLLITFDYEVFLGRNSGSVKKSLIDPTEKLICLFGEYGVKAIFFVDTTYLLRMNELALSNHRIKSDYDSIVQQIQKLIKEGHYVYPHIHPHWIDAKYMHETNTWDLSDHSKYRIENLNEVTVEILFDNSIELLNSIIKPVKPDYSSDGYRAGGWSIQPFRSFEPCFKKHNIKYDFSVIPGKYFVSDAQKYDFRKAPLKFKYSFSDDVCQEDVDGSFTEFTISTIKLNRFFNYINKKYKSALYMLNFSASKSVGDGKPVIANIVEKEDASNEERQIASFEGLTPIMVLSYLKEISNTGRFHFISHPKMLSKLDFIFLSIFLRILCSKYFVQNDFRKIE